MSDLTKSYPGGECPDCGEPIPQTAEEGDECRNCGHVFWVEEGEKVS